MKSIVFTLQLNGGGGGGAISIFPSAAVMKERKEMRLLPICACCESRCAADCHFLRDSCMTLGFSLYVWSFIQNGLFVYSKQQQQRKWLESIYKADQ